MGVKMAMYLVHKLSQIRNQIPKTRRQSQVYGTKRECSNSASAHCKRINKLPVTNDFTAPERSHNRVDHFKNQ
jgi:hypothetical protein